MHMTTLVTNRFRDGGPRVGIPGKALILYSGWIVIKVVRCVFIQNISIETSFHTACKGVGRRKGPFSISSHMHVCLSNIYML